MKVLWITNILFPDICEKIGKEKPVVGGWMYSSAQALINLNYDLELHVASLYNGKELQFLKINDINYILVPNKTKSYVYPVSLEKYWKFIKSKIRPDIIHIHGSEYPHVLSYLKSCGNENVVLSIQGLVNNFQRYYFGNISFYNLIKNLTIRDILKFDSTFIQKKHMKIRGDFEIESISRLINIIGRTEYDFSNVWSINPHLNYHHNDEILRDIFYHRKWVFKSCKLHSIFISQSHYPIKGLHKLFEALPLVLREFPYTKIRIVGKNILKKSFFRINTYDKYLIKLIKKLNLEDKIEFLGSLKEDQMCKEFLNCHVFVSPSAIENSSNSIGEAQLLGVPCIASYVGGITNLIIDGQTGLLYRFEENEMLAKNICEIFSNEELAVRLSKNAQEVANKRHSVKQNTLDLLNIYKKIVFKN